MSAPDDALDPIVERADDRETWVGIKQGDHEDREFARLTVTDEMVERAAKAVWVHDGGRINPFEPPGDGNWGDEWCDTYLEDARIALMAALEDVA